MVDSATKAAYFQSLGVSADRLPRGIRLVRGKPRYFPGVIPIRTARGNAPMVEFLSPRAGSRAHHFERRLQSYEPLPTGLRAIGIGCRWRVLTDDHVQLLRLRNARGKWGTSHKRDPTQPEYFALRRSAEKQRYEELSGEDIDHFAELRCIHEHEGLASPFRTTDRRYGAWLERRSPLS